MNKRASLFFILILPIFVLAQNPYYDVLTLKKYVVNGKIVVTDPAGEKEVGGILEEYKIKKTAGLDANPFLIGMIGTGITPSGAGAAAKFEGNYNLGASGFGLSSISGLNVTSFADGMAQFLVERAKNELNVAFFQRFKDYLEKNPEIQILFPKTTKTLEGLLAADYGQFMSALKYAFFSDLKNVINNVEDLFKLPKYKELILRFPEIPISLDLIQVFANVDRGIHPADVVIELSEIPAWETYADTINADNKKYLYNSENSIKLLKLISESIRIDDSSGEEGWVKFSDMRSNIFEDEVAFQLFVGLVYQQCVNEEIIFKTKSTETDVCGWLASKQSEMHIIRDLYSDFLIVSGNIDGTIKETKDVKRSGEKISQDLVYRYATNIIELMEFGYDVAKFIDPTIDCGEMFDIVESGNEFYMNLSMKEYGAAAFNVSQVLQDLFKLVEKDNDSMIGMIPGNSGLTKEVKKENKEKKKSLKKDNVSIEKVLPKAIEFYTFMANVLEAKDADQVKVAIQAAAMPSGSSSIKKYFRNNVALGAYLGGYYRIGNDDADMAKDSWNRTYGFIAPIGIAYTPLSFGKCGSVTIFASILDVGALAQFRLSNDSTEITEEIKLGNIFAPGGYLVYGFGANLPLSLGIGGQYGPGLNNIGLDEQEAATLDVSTPSWRWNVFLAVDIPLVNFSKGKAIKK